VPVNLARYIMERLISDGKGTRGYLGAKIQTLTPELATQLKLSGQTGALISEVTPNSSAEKAGLKKNDVIIEFDGKGVTDSRHFRLMVAELPPGSKVASKSFVTANSKLLLSSSANCLRTICSSPAGPAILGANERR
jgi:serine protease Do